MPETHSTKKESGLVTVVITNYNRCDDLREAILSIQRQDYAHIEIIVVDNASVDDSRRMLKSEFPSVMLIELDENIGMDGYSEGFSRANGEFVFQMDNDSLMPDTNVLSEVVKRFRSGPSNLGVVATRVEEYNPQKDQIEALRRRSTDTGPINTGGFHSGGVGFKKFYLDQVGYYNRDVFLYVSEMFLQMKFLAAGYKVLFYPEILMLHKSSGTARSNFSVYYELRNRYWFFRRFANPVQQMFFFPMILLNDMAYIIGKGAYRQFLKALIDGFRTMPDSLKPQIRCRHADYINKVNEIGMQFTPANTVRHILKRLGRNVSIKTDIPI